MTSQQVYVLYELRLCSYVCVYHTLSVCPSFRPSDNLKKMTKRDGNTIKLHEPTPANTQQNKI